MESSKMLVRFLIHIAWVGWGAFDMGGGAFHKIIKNQSTVYNHFPLLHLMFNYELDSEVMHPRLCTHMSLV